MSYRDLHDKINLHGHTEILFNPSALNKIQDQ